jgi:flagellar biosynthesis protein FliR
MSTVGAPPNLAPVADERLANIGLTARILRRPEIGALLAAIVVAIFFWTQSSLFLQLDGIANWTDVASTIGIPAVMVALLATNLAFGVLARAAPALNPIQLGLPVAVLTGLFLLAVLVGELATPVQALFDAAWATGARVAAP